MSCNPKVGCGAVLGGLPTGREKKMTECTRYQHAKFQGDRQHFVLISEVVAMASNNFFQSSFIH